MLETDYSLTKLWPEFARLFAGDFTSPEGLSAAIVAILFALALLFSVWSIINYIRASQHLRFYKGLLKGLTVEQLLDRRRELVNTALENPTHGRLWREFDESLVHIPQKQRLCNTLDAAHFFNTHTIARGLTENRLLAAVPGFLTAIGVIGTFSGLQLGLGPLGGLDPTNAKVDDLTHGIFGMIGGASIAFMTSVWGVLTSVLFNFFEKSLERNIRGSITSFQNEVDYLYPRITAEQSLSNIEDFTRQSNDRLAELDEKIGHKMQEAMREASGVISESVAQSLNTILGPAIERLVDNAQSGSEKALESLLERFLQGVGSAGDSQKAMMEQAAKDIATASGGMAEGLNQFSSKLEGQVNSMMEKNADVLNQVNGVVKQQLETQSQQEKERQEQLTASMGEFMANLKTQLAALAEQNATTLKTVQGELSSQIEEQQGREIARQKVLHDQLKGFQSAQEHVTGGIDSMLSMQKEQNAELLSGLRSVIDRFEQLSVSHQSATSAMQTTSSELKAGSNQLGILSSNLKATIDSFGQQLSAALNHADVVTKSNAETAALFKTVVEDLRSAGEGIVNASGTLNEAASKAENGLTSVDRHFNTLAESLQTHLAAVQKQVADLLSDYGERVQSQTVTRLNTWNEQTNSYISSMTDAVRTLSSVVDEIDGKVSPHHAGSNI
ncbi:anti-phage ZorAB system protein ZorA [Haliea salexigens]|uniref:anti-phage ZorAB system protein ZorA n=1 Tax=Haliea salexigens TaxID=287487 RepID=UPI0003F6E875|nr:anti-phage ZorAB system protein ZorA [Haliea salexigens]